MADILVVVEHQDGVFKKNTLSAVTAAKALAGLTGGEVDALVLGGGVAPCGRRRGRHGRGRSSSARGRRSRSTSPVRTRRGGAGWEGDGYGAAFAPASTVREGFHAARPALLDAPLASDIVGLEARARCG